VGVNRALNTIALGLISVLLAGCSAEAGKTPGVIRSSATANLSTNAIVRENAYAGSGAWKSASNNQITGYADSTSVEVGGRIQFAISTTRTTFNLDVYRLGWYGGLGARKMLSDVNFPGADQGHWTGGTFGVASCATCEVDAVTGLVDANWTWSYSLTIPSSWTSGVYIARLSAANDRGSIPFVVRNDVSPTTLLAVLPVNTWQAYNYWGGKSLYASSAYGDPTIAGDKRAVKVSFNRPYVGQAPTAQDVNVISFLERSGYDVSYSTDVDLDSDPQILSRHRLYVAVGHDEYWTKGMRDAVETARDLGLNLAFLGGNDVYWQARYEADASGNAGRTLVVYRSASLDPVSATDPAAATVRWESPPVNRPQNSLTGTLFSNGYPPSPQPWKLGAGAPAWLLRGTALKAGDSIPGLVSGECDRTQPNAELPPSLVVIGSAVFKTVSGQLEHCDSTWYTQSTGSAVFSAADLGWPNLVAGPAGDDRVIALTRNLLDRLVTIQAN
jgi:N,N-dimethylformamidase beta subunit-like, C-terminal